MGVMVTMMMVMMMVMVRVMMVIMMIVMLMIASHCLRTLGAKLLSLVPTF